MSNLKRIYLGECGENHVASEFLLHGYNIAVPVIDHGSELLVIHEGTDRRWPIQVKTAGARKLASPGFTTSYILQLDRLLKPAHPDLTYIFATRHEDGWAPLVIMPRTHLLNLYESATLQEKGARSKFISLSLRHQSGSVYYKNKNLSKYIEDWNNWPRLI